MISKAFFSLIMLVHIGLVVRFIQEIPTPEMLKEFTFALGYGYLFYEFLISLAELNEANIQGRSYQILEKEDEERERLDAKETPQAENAERVEANYMDNDD